MINAKQIIDQLALSKHPEGGYYKETYRAILSVDEDIQRDGFRGKRNISTSIYFLLSSEEHSALHRIKSDEIWNYHLGDPISIYIFDNRGMRIEILGPDILKGEKLQVVVPARAWFGAMVNKGGSFALCGCSVSPGFDFADFELAKRSHLLNEYPDFKKEITMLTNS